MRRIFAKWVPKCLNVNHKRKRVEESYKIRARSETALDILSRVVTMDEFHIYNPVTRQQWKHAGSPGP